MRSWISAIRRLSSRRVLLGSTLAAVLLSAALTLLFVVVPRRLPGGALVVPQDFPTIQAALDHATSGTSIVVQAGRGPYTGPLEIHTEDVSLSSVGGRALLKGAGAAPAILIRADGVTVRGFVIEGGEVGLMVQDAAQALLTDISVVGVRVGVELVGAYGVTLTNLDLDVTDTGIETTSSGGSVFRDIRIVGPARTGIALTGSWANLIEAVAVTDAQVGISLVEDCEENEIFSCQLKRCTISGIEISHSAGNSVAKNVIDQCAIGILLQSAKDNTVSENQITNSAESGVQAHESDQNTISNNSISTCRKSGIAVLEGESNTIRDNVITDCAGPGLSLESTTGNLVLFNHLERNVIGAKATYTCRTRLLRNTVRGNSLAGMVLERSKGNLFLNNLIADNPFGVALIRARENQLLRNVITDSSEQGVSLLNLAKNNLIEGNRLEKNGVGVLLSSSPLNTVVENSMVGNGTAVKLFLSGLGTRVEANSITGNKLGIEIAATLDREQTILRVLEVELLREGESDSSLAITNNVFSRNEGFDILNQTDEVIFAGGNRWVGPVREPNGEQGLVSSGVLIPKAVWKGPVAIGSVNSLDQVILGRLLQICLQFNGFKVVDLIGLGSSESVIEALRQGDVNLAWGAPHMLDQEALQSFGLAQLQPVPLQNRVVVAVSAALAAELPALTVSELARLAREGGSKVVFAIPAAISKGEFEAFASAYGLLIGEGDVVWTSDLDETETLLRLGKANAGLVGLIEETLTLSGFSLLEDDRDFFRPSVPTCVLRQDLLRRYPEIAALAGKLASLLTTETMRSLVGRVRLLHLEPKEVAREFLVREKLITW